MSQHSHESGHRDDFHGDHDHDHHDHDDHREGLSHDLPQMQARGMVGTERRRDPSRNLHRRGLFGLVGGLGAVTLVACASDGESTTIGSTDSSSAAGRTRPTTGPGGDGPAPDGGGDGGGGDVSQADLDDGDIPEETNGPYPADNSNGVNVLSESGIVREDIRASFGDATGVAEGVQLSIQLKVYDNDADAMTPYAGAAVYIWHCDRDGLYSLYSDGVTQENYLRGVQQVAADGSLSFTSIFPACYSGRWPHLHFEVYGSLDDATSASNKLRTSQIAFPEDICNDVYASAEGYESSQSTFAQVSLDSDGIFSDGYSLQMGALTGSNDNGYTLKLNVPV